MNQQATARRQAGQTERAQPHGPAKCGKQAPPTFVVQVRSTQNQSWQGTVTWLDGGETQSFRSAWELLKLMESVL